MVLRGRVLLVLTLPLVACFPPSLSLKFYKDLDSLMDAEKYEEALAKIEKEKHLYGEKSALLFLMDKAMILSLAGRLNEANALLDAAEELIEGLYTRRLTREAASFLTSDASLPYEGEDFEKVFLNVLAAINYARLGQFDEAAVEARKADLKLAEMARTRGQETAYGEDAFVRLLMGLVYEEAGETNDAWISYARAIRSYQKYGFGLPVPSVLLWRASVVAAALGFEEELEKLKKEFPEIRHKVPGSEKGLGRIVVIEFAGNIPLKYEERVEVTLGQGLIFVQRMQVQSAEQMQVASALSAAKTLAAGTNIVIAYPALKAERPTSAPLKVYIRTPNGVMQTLAEHVQNLAAIAPVCLKERIGRIWAKTVARAVVKFLLAFAAGKAGEAAGGKKYGWLTGFIAGAATGAVLQASERADTRSWGTLPAEVRLAVIALPPGEYDIEFAGTSFRKERVRVEANRSTWRLVRTR